jgi:HK97 family phage major capsid protein
MREFKNDLLRGGSAATLFSGYGPKPVADPEGRSGAADGGAKEVDFEKLVNEFKGATDNVNKMSETFQTEIKNLGTVTKETKDKTDEAIAKLVPIAKQMDEAKARLDELEQKAARRAGNGSPTELKTIGQAVIDNEEVKSLMAGAAQRARVTIDLKDITTATATQGTGTSASTSLVMADRQGMVNLPERRFTIRDLVTPGQTVSNNIEYPVEVVFTNAAAPVAEGATKPQSNVTFDLKSAPVRTLAHFMRASRQIMEDAPGLRSYIDGRLRYGLDLVEENQLLNGDGTGQNLLGLIPQATAFAAPFAVTGETDIDRIRLAILQATQALYPVTGVVLNVLDWAKIEMTKDSLGRYIVGDPTGQLVPRLWGLPVVATVGMTAGQFLTGAFRMGAQIFDRMAIEVLISTEDQDNFVKNLITIRGEERLAFAVYRPQAFITGALPQ